MAGKAPPVTIAKAAPAKPALTKASAPMIQRKCACGGTPGMSGMCPACEAKKERAVLQRKAAGPSTMSVPSVVNTVLNSPGQPLDLATRSSMEGKFGHDLSGVRVHTDSRAAESARAIQAHAYTVGQDIVFDHGKYDPDVPSGRHLLAHELAHTIQQGGLQRSPSGPLEVSPEYSALEYEADRAASAVASGFAAPSIQQTAAPVISRTPNDDVTGDPVVTNAPTSVGGGSSNPSSPQVVPGATSDAPTPPELDQSKLSQAGVVQILDTDPPGGIHRIFVIDQFDLPAEKGPLSKSMYDQMAANNQLRSTIDFGTSAGASPASGGSQARDRTGTLRTSWLQRVGWAANRAPAYWTQVGGKPSTSGFMPKLASDVICDMDHILELQLGGTNVPENVQVLDPSPNRSSGSGIYNWLVAKAQLIREAHPTTEAPRQVTMVFRQVNPVGALPVFQQYTGNAPSCISIEGRLQSPLDGAEAEEAPLGRTHIRLFSGAQGTSLYAQPTGETDLSEPVPQNRGVRQLVPGFILDKYRKSPAGQPDVVPAKIDSGRFSGRSGATSIPINIDVTKHPNPTFKAEEAGTDGADPRRELSFHNMTDPVMRFNYPYLSPADLRLAYASEEGFTGTGTLRPSLPLLRNSVLNLTLGGGRLSGELAANVSQWRPLGPARVTRAALSATLLPELGAEGNLDMVFGPAARPYASANLNITLNRQGLEASGTLLAHIPRVDEARGQIFYRNGAWGGQIRVQSSQLRIPNVTNCTVVIDIDRNGIRPSGQITLDVRGNPVNLGARLEGNNWVFFGNATMTFRPLDPTRVEFRYSNGVLTGSGSTGFTYRGLRGTITLRYDDGRISGDGTLNMTRGRMSGTINANLLPSGVITADGTITYQVTPSLRGTVGVEIDAQQNVRLTGELRFTQPIPLFRRFGTNRELFRRNIDIPIAGISLGVTSIGLVFRITGSLAVDYGIGDGRIENLHLSAAFNPFDENPNFELMGGGRLVIPASAGFTIGVRGALAVSAGIASVSGGLTASARVGLEVNASNDLAITYRQGRYTIENTARIIAQPILDFRLAADVEAEAGGGLYRYYRAYELASHRLGSGLQMGIEAPFRYASDEPFRAPSLDQIRIITPDLDVPGIMRGMLQRVGVM
jgi:hypothetical protein